MTTPRFSRRDALRLGSVLTASLALSACSPSTPASEPEPTGSQQQEPLTFRFAQGGHVLALDPAQTTRIESHRISAQILEPLVQADVNTGEPLPGLASSWDISDDRLTYTFTLKSQVTFSDGTTLTATTVLENFERWSKIGRQGKSRAAHPFTYLFGSIQGSATPAETSAPATNSTYASAPLVTSWEAPDELTVTVQLSRPSTSFLKVLTQPAYGLVEPSIIGANGLLTADPIGTGAYMLETWDGQEAALTRNPTYHKEAPQIDRISFLTMPNPETRYYNLLQGTIDAYDQVALKDYVPLALDGYAVQSRDPYAIAYVGINLQHPALSDTRTRQALARAIDRPKIISDYYPQGTTTANDFLPALFQVKSEGANQVYGYDPQQAKNLLNTSSYKGEPIDFYYPTNLSLPSLPSPEAIYSVISTNLVAAGFTIVPRPYRWDEAGSEDIPTAHPSYGLELTGFVGAYRDPTAFLGTVLAPIADEASQVQLAIAQADTLTDVNEWRQAYQEVNEEIANLLLAVPLLYPVSGVTQGARVASYAVNATAIDSIQNVTLKD